MQINARSDLQAYRTCFDAEDPLIHPAPIPPHQPTVIDAV